jgi:hypothetical protein
MFFIWVGLAVLKPFNWREWVFTFTGFLVPIFFTFSFYYLLYNDPLRLYHDYKAAFSIGFYFSNYHVSTIIFLGTLVLLILIASQFMLRTFQSMKILPRKAFTIIFWLFVNTLAVYILIRQASVEMIFLAAIPVSYLLTNYFTFMKARLWGNFFLILIIGLIIWIQLA